MRRSAQISIRRKVGAVEFAFRRNAPVPWQLTPREIDNLEPEWNSTQNQTELKRLEQLARSR